MKGEGNSVAAAGNSLIKSVGLKFSVWKLRPDPEVRMDLADRECYGYKASLIIDPNNVIQGVAFDGGIA